MLTNFFYNLLVFFTALIPGHYVWIAIILITVILRLIFLRPSIKMIEVQQKQKALQGEVDEIKKRHNGDKQAEQKALMELYKREGFNPLASCLPMIIQFIVLIGFYRIFTGVGLDGIKGDILYSFTPRPDTLNISFFGLDLSKTVAELAKTGGVAGYAAYLFPLVAGATQLVQALQTKSLQGKPKKDDKQNSMQTAMMSQFTYLFPIMTAYISYTLASALSIYWITQTLFMIAQHKYTTKFYKVEKELHKDEERIEQEIEKKPEAKKFKKGGVEVTVREKE